MTRTPNLPFVSRAGRFPPGQAACRQSLVAFERRCIPAERPRFASLIVALRSKYTRYSSLARLVSRAPRPHREDWPLSALSALTPLCPQATDGANRCAAPSFPAGRGYPSPHPTPAALRAANGRGEILDDAGSRQLRLLRSARGESTPHRAQGHLRTDADRLFRVRGAFPQRSALRTDGAPRTRSAPRTIVSDNYAGRGGPYPSPGCTPRADGAPAALFRAARRFAPRTDAGRCSDDPGQLRLLRSARGESTPHRR